MLKQILVSLLVLVVAAAGYVYFVPGSDTVLRNMGVTFPIPTSYSNSAANVAAATPGSGAGAPCGGQRQAGANGQQAAAGGRPAGGAGGPGGYGRQITPTVVVAAVTTATINDRLSAIGEGTATQSVTITPQATGTLVSLSVKPGDTVKAGQVVGNLDSDAEQIAFDKAQLAFNDATDTLNRTQTLAKSNNATTVQLNAAQLAYDTTKLGLQSAKLDLDKRAIVTPIGGTVGLFQVTAGNAVTASTALTTVDDTSVILVNYWVPERYAPSIAIGAHVTAQAAALPGQNFDGTVNAVDSRIDPTSRTLQVQAKVPNPNGAIRPGMSFEVAMAFAGDTFPAVDPLAVQWSSDGSYVWLLTADSKVKKDPVEIVERNSDGVLVKGNLKPGDQVVTQGVLQIAEGQTVRRINDIGGGAANGAAPSGAPAGSGNPAAGGKPAGTNKSGGGAPGGTAPPANGGAAPAAAPATAG